MQTYVIRFGRQEVFVQEGLNQGGRCFRVSNTAVVLNLTARVSGKTLGLRLAGIGVRVRVITDGGQILACYPLGLLRTGLPVVHILLYNARRDGDPGWQEYDEVWRKAEVLKEHAIAYLEQVVGEKGFTVRAAGVIDIGKTRPLRTTWLADPIQA